MNGLDSYMAFFTVIFLLLPLLLIASAVFFGLAAYQDAKSLNRTDATMWGLLIGFLGLIPGIIYLCIRKNAPRPTPMQQVCVNCRTPLYPGAQQCPACGATQPPPMYPAPAYYPQAFLSPEQCAVHHRLAKKFLIAAIILFCCAIVAIIALVCTAVFLASSALGEYPFY